MRKLWYAAITTKYEVGNYFLIGEVVRDDARTAVASFSIVSFSDGLPSFLQ